MVAFQFLYFGYFKKFITFWLVIDFPIVELLSIPRELKFSLVQQFHILF